MRVRGLCLVQAGSSRRWALGGAKTLNCSFLVLTGGTLCACACVCVHV